MEHYVLVYETLSGFKSKTFKKHIDAFKACEDIEHRNKGVYLVNISTISPINISFNPHEKNYQEAIKYLLNNYPSLTWRP